MFSCTSELGDISIFWVGQEPGIHEVIRRIEQDNIIPGMTEDVKATGGLSMYASKEYMTGGSMQPYILMVTTGHDMPSGFLSVAPWPDYAVFVKTMNGPWCAAGQIYEKGNIPAWMGRQN